VVLNLSADHMDRYHGMSEYAAAKARIYRDAAVQVVNLDDTGAAALADGNRPQIGYTLGEPAAGQYGIRPGPEGPALAYGDETLMPVQMLRMAGRHNQSNALAALALGDALELPRIAMLETLRSFGGLPHRTQWVTEANGVNWYNDSKGTNVGATLAAISGFDQPIVLIAGGQGKGADFSPLHDVVCARARAVVLIGEDAERIERALGGCTTVEYAADMDAAVKQAAGLAQSGDVVLLSPACASFDMFAGYEDRGRCFIEAIERWVG
jgi:UDP-N-acetylmuramoylalanine--D-glutamate ligase